MDPSKLFAEIREAFTTKVDEIPTFEMLGVDNVAPRNVATKVIQCSQTLDGVGYCLAEIAIIANQVSTLYHEIRRTSNQYEEADFNEMESWLNNMRIHLEQRSKTLASHSSVLRGLVSAFGKNPSLADQIMSATDD